MSIMHVRPTTMLVLKDLRAMHPRETTGYEIAKRTGLLKGTVYSILKRMEERGLVEGRVEERLDCPDLVHRKLTDMGVEEVDRVFAFKEAEAEPKPPEPRSPYVESELLLAVMEGDDHRFDGLVRKLSFSEAMKLSRYAHDLAVRLKVHVEAAAYPDGRNDD